MKRLITPIILFITLFAFYAYTAAPEVTFHDSGELVTAAYTLGIPHPPGAPTWCILTHIFTLLPFGSPAWRVHVACGFFGALACVFVYLLSLKLVASKHEGSPSFLCQVAAIASAMSLAMTPAFWDKCTQAELYTLNVLFLSVILYLFLIWRDLLKVDNANQNSVLISIALLFGIGSGNYLALLYYVPIIGVAIIASKPAVLKNWRLILMGLAAFCTGFAIHLYLPLRSLANPPIDWGNPETLDAFISVLKREQWGGFGLSNYTGEFISYWIESYDFAGQIGFAGLLTALIGLAYMIKKQTGNALLLISCFVIYAITMMLMQATTETLNKDLSFVSKYGLDEFHLPLYFIIAVLVSPGIIAIFTWLKGRALLGNSKVVRRTLVTCLTIVIVLSGHARHLKQYSARDFTQADFISRQIMDSVPRDGWIVAWNNTAEFTLYYQKFCKNYRTDTFILDPSRELIMELINKAKDKESTIRSQTIVDIVRSDPTRFTAPILNQDSIDSRQFPGVVFAGLPEGNYMMSHIYPDATVFKLYNKKSYSKEKQMKFWKLFLNKKEIKLKPEMRHEARSSMVLILRNHADWHYVMREYDMARFLYLEAIKYSPFSGTLIAHLEANAASSMLRCDDIKGAYQLSAEAAKHDGSNTLAWETLGITLIAQNRNTEALSCFENILKTDPKNTRALKHIERLKKDMKE